MPVKHRAKAGAPIYGMTLDEWAMAQGYNTDTRAYDRDPRPDLIKSQWIARSDREDLSGRGVEPFKRSDLPGVFQPYPERVRRQNQEAVEDASFTSEEVLSFRAFLAGLARPVSPPAQPSASPQSDPTDQVA